MHALRQTGKQACCQYNGIYVLGDLLIVRESGAVCGLTANMMSLQQISKR